MHVLLIKTAELACENSCHGARGGLSLYIYQTGMYLRNQGFKAEVIDNNGLKKIEYDNYDAVCAFVCLPIVFYKEIEYLRLAKEAGKITILFLHNSFGKIEEDILREHKFIDYAIIHYDREISLAYLLRKLSSLGLSDDVRLDKNCGVVARNKQEIINYGLRKENIPLDHLVSCVPLLKESDLSGYKRDVVHILTGRGCPFSCEFCEMRNTSPQKRKVEYIIDEVRYLSRYFSHFFFVDPDFSFNKEWMTDLCRGLIKNRFSFTWETAIRADNCQDPRLLKMMKDAGCVELELGVETIDSATGDLSDKLNKRITQDIQNNAENNLKNIYIFPMWSLIIGLPWDTNESLRQVENFMKAHYGTFCIQMIRPFLDTPIYGKLRDNGLLKEELSYRDFIKKDVAYCGTNHMSEKEVYEWYLRLEELNDRVTVKNKRRILLRDGLLFNNRHNRTRAVRFFKTKVRVILDIFRKEGRLYAKTEGGSRK